MFNNSLFFASSNFRLILFLFKPEFISFQEGYLEIFIDEILYNEKSIFFNAENFSEKCE